MEPAETSGQWACMKIDGDKKNGPHEKINVDVKDMHSVIKVEMTVQFGEGLTVARTLMKVGCGEKVGSILESVEKLYSVKAVAVFKGNAV